MAPGLALPPAALGEPIEGGDELDASPSFDTRPQPQERSTDTRDRSDGDDEVPTSETGLFAKLPVWGSSAFDRLGLTAAAGQLMALETRGRWLYSDTDGNGVALRLRKSINPVVVDGTPVKYREGGLWSELHFEPADWARLSFGVLAGVARVSWFDVAASDKEAAWALVVAPELQLELELSEHLRLGLALGYRIVGGDDLAGVIDDPIGGFSGTVLLDVVDF